MDDASKKKDLSKKKKSKVVSCLFQTKKKDGKGGLVNNCVRNRKSRVYVLTRMPLFQSKNCPLYLVQLKDQMAWRFFSSK